VENEIQKAGSVRNWALLLGLMPTEGKTIQRLPIFAREPLLKLLFAGDDGKLNRQVQALTKLRDSSTESRKIPTRDAVHGTDVLLAMLAGCKFDEGERKRSLERTTPADQHYEFDTIGVKTPRFGVIEITETPANTPLRIAFFFGLSRGTEDDQPGAKGFADLDPSAWQNSWDEKGPLPREKAWRALAGGLQVESETEYWGGSVNEFLTHYCSALQSDGLLWTPKDGSDGVSSRRRRSAGWLPAAEGDQLSPVRGADMWILKRSTPALITRGGEGDLQYLQQKHVHLDCRAGLSKDGVRYGFIEALAQFAFSKGLNPDVIANFASRPEPLRAPGVGVIIISRHSNNPLTFLIRREDKRPLPNAMLFADEAPPMFELREPATGGIITLRLIARASDLRLVDSDDADAQSADREDALHRTALANLLRLSAAGQQVNGVTVPYRSDDAVILDDGAFVFSHEDE
jgi:hypothetical protein